jgi:HEAT repeat protein
VIALEGLIGGFTMCVHGISDDHQGNDVQKLVKKLKHPHASERLKAIEYLAQKGPEAKTALPNLILSLVDFDALVRQTARQTLEVIDPAWTADSIVKPVLPQLVKALGKSLTREPQWAQSVLSEIGKSAVPELTKALSDDRDYVLQVWAARTLGSIGPDAGDAAVDLGRALNNTQIHIREAAAKALAELGVASEPALLELVRALHDKHPPIRLAAARALQKLGPTASIAIPGLVNLLCDCVDDVHKSAMDALAAIGTKAVPPLIRILENRTQRRSEAFTELLVDMLKVFDSADPSALGHYRVESCRNLRWHLQCAFERNPEKIHTVATIVLGMIGPEANEAIPVLTDMLKTENSLLRREAAHAIRRIGYAVDSDLEALVEATTHENPRGESYALETLSEIDPKLLNRLQIEEFLISLPRKCINTRDRETARKLLKRIVKVETHTEEDIWVRKAAEKALKKMARGRPRSGTDRRPRRPRGFGFGGSR